MHDTLSHASDHLNIFAAKKSQLWQSSGAVVVRGMRMPGWPSLQQINTSLATGESVEIQSLPWNG